MIEDKGVHFEDSINAWCWLSSMHKGGGHPQGAVLQSCERGQDFDRRKMALIA